MQTHSIESLDRRILLSQFYVSPAGDDSALGTEQAPWQTLQRAANYVIAGDTVHVAAGQYSGFVMGWDKRQSGTQAEPITFEGGKDVYIVSRNSKTPDGINLEGASNVIIDGFHVAPADGEDPWRAGIRSTQNQRTVIRDNTVQMRGKDRYGVFSSFTSHLVVEGNDVSGTNNSGIYTSNSAMAPTIRGNTVHDVGGNGLHFNGDIAQGGTGVITDAVVEDNVVYETGRLVGGSAMNMDGVQKSRIQNNRLYNNHAKGITLYQIDSAAPSIDNVVESNVVRMAADARGYALTVKNGSTGNTFIGNIFTNDNPRQGSINIDAPSLKGLRSNQNVITAGVSLDDGWRRLTLEQWQQRTGQDKDSRSSIPGEAPTTQAAMLTQKTMLAIQGFILAMGVAAIAVLAWMRRKAVHRWMLPYAAQVFRRRSPDGTGPIHVLLCVCDHYEPHNGKAGDATARFRVHRWVQDYPRLFGAFRDSDGRMPRHTFFYPMEQYHRWAIEELSGLCRRGCGEVEIHLHHDHDTSAALRAKFESYKQILVKNHNLLPRDRESGQPKYGFIHGNWALDNSRPDGRWCGVNDELDVLVDTGCYADFTLPSAPSPTQTAKINSIYYAVDDPAAPRSHDRGVDVGTAPRPDRSLMLIQGPLVLNWRNRKWGLLPRIENACLQGSQPPTMSRLELWLRARVQVAKRPDWYFVKLHTHGAPEENQKVLLGRPMVRFHEQLAARAQRDPNFHFHYVTAREMYNLARAAEAGWTGSVDEARDFELVPGDSTRRPAQDSRETVSKAHFAEGAAAH